MAESDSISSVVSPHNSKSELSQGKAQGQRGLGHVYLHRKNWWLDVRLRGQRYRRKLGPYKLLEKRQARAMADEIIGKLYEPQKPVVKGDMPFSEYAEKFAAYYTVTRPRDSWLKYKGCPVADTPLRHAVRYFGERPLREITQAAVEDYRAYLAQRTVGKRMRRPLTVTTVNKNISLLRALFYRAMQDGEAERNPVADLPRGQKLGKEKPLAERILEMDEQGKLLDALPGWLRLMAIFCLQTAARRGDLVRLRWRAVHPAYVEFLETKECKKRIIRLSSVARAVLATVAPRKVAEDAFVFEPQIKDRVGLEWRIAREWGRAVRRAGIPHIRFHDLRHTALTRLVACGTDLRTVQQIAGHASLNTTQRYLHSSDKQQQAAVDRLAGDFGRWMPSAAQVEVKEKPVTATIQ